MQQFSWDVPETNFGNIIQDLTEENERLRAAIRKTLEANRHLADGEDCTLIDLKRAIGEA